MLKVLLFWDYDTQWGADRSRAGKGAKDFGHLEFSNTELLLDLHEQYQVPSCFAVVGAAALPGERPYHDPNQIKKIHSMGHEIGSHSFHHDWLPELNSNELKKTLINSKDALEQCIGADVISFVPPFNQPFDYPAKLSFSRGERKQIKGYRTNIPKLCDALNETGYKFSRIAYKTIFEKLKLLTSSSIDITSKLETINGIKCLRLNTNGFASDVVDTIKKNINSDNYVVIYGHPHSVLEEGNRQHIKLLENLFKEINILKEQNLLEITLPKHLV